MLPYREKVISDRGYKGNPFCVTPDDSLNEEHKKFMPIARARHETINRRFKQWGCLAIFFANMKKNTSFCHSKGTQLVSKNKSNSNETACSLILSPFVS